MARMTRLLACALVVALIAALSGGVALSDDKVSIVAWEMYGPDRGMDKWTDQFNQSQDKITVKDEFLVSHTELMQKLQVVAASGAELPNLVLVDMFYAPVVNELVDGLVDLNPYLDQEPGMREDFYENLLAFSDIDGKQISLHSYANNLVLYYNKALFAEAGLDPEQPPKTWDEMVEMAKKLTKDGQWGMLNTAFSDSYYETVSWNFQAYTWQNGGQVWTDDFHAAMNSPEAIGALKYMSDLVNTDKVSTTAPPENGFQLGKIAMIVDGTWNNANFQEYLGDDLAATQLPAGIESATNTGGEHWMILPSTKEKEDASWAYLKHMLSPEVVTNICSMGGQVPTRKSISDSGEFQAFANERPGIRASLDSLPIARMRAATPKYGQASEAIATYIQQAIYNTITPEDACAQMETAWNKAMGF